MAAWPKISRGGVFSKNFRPGGVYQKYPPIPPIPVACSIIYINIEIKNSVKSPYNSKQFELVEKLLSDRMS